MKPIHFVVLLFLAFVFAVGVDLAIRRESEVPSSPLPDSPPICPQDVFNGSGPMPEVHPTEFHVVTEEDNFLADAGFDPDDFAWAPPRTILDPLWTPSQLSLAKRVQMRGLVIDRAALAIALRRISDDPDEQILMVEMVSAYGAERLLKDNPTDEQRHELMRLFNRYPDSEEPSVVDPEVLAILFGVKPEQVYAWLK